MNLVAYPTPFQVGYMYMSIAVSSGVVSYIVYVNITTEKQACWVVCACVCVRVCVCVCVIVCACVCECH